MSAFVGLLLSPLMLALLLFIVRPGVRWIDRVMPESRLKRALFLYWTN